MKKAVLFLGLLGGLSSCSLDGTPKCDDKEVLELVEKIVKQHEKAYTIDIYADYYGPEWDREWMDKLESQLREYISKMDLKNSVEIERRGMLGRNFDYMDRHPDMYSHETISLLKEYESKIRKEYDEQFKERLNYVSDKSNIYKDEKLKALYDEYYGMEISNIRSTFSNEEIKKCGCEGIVKYNYIYRGKTQHNIEYTAQRNSDGEVYVEVFR